MENQPCLHKRKRPQTPGPDGAEAWRVALAACFINFIMAGIGRTSGILYVEFIDIFHTDRKQASLPITVRSLTRNLLGPLVGILGQKYGVRPIIIVGGIIGTISAAACFYVEDIFWMTVVWGGFNGFGAAMITTLTQAAIGEHFVKHRSTASGMGFSGGCVGSFFFPAILDILFYEYNLGGTFLFISGIIMHVIPAAILMNKPTWKKSIVQSKSIIDGSIYQLSDDIILKTEPENGINEFNETDSLRKNSLSSKHSLNGGVVSYCPKHAEEEQFCNSEINNELLLKNKELVVGLLTDDISTEITLFEINQNEFLSNDILIKEIEDLFCEILTDNHIDDIIKDHGFHKGPISDSCLEVNGIAVKPYQHSFKNVPYISEDSTCQLTDTYLLNPNRMNILLFCLENLSRRQKQSMIYSFSESEREEVSKILDELLHIYNLLKNSHNNIYFHSHSPASQLLENDKACFESRIERPNTWSSHITTAVKLNTKPMFLLICLCRSTHFLTLVPMVTTVVDFSRDKGLPEDYGKYVIAALSAGDLIGRLFTGWITDKGFMSLPRYMLIFMILLGISTAILSVMNSTASLLISLAVYGLLQGCVFIQHPVLVSHYLGKDEQSIALGCINFFSGILGFILPFYIGYFRDTMGSYNGIFYINGGLGAFVGMLWAFEPYFLKISKPRSGHTQPIQV